jgi:mannose-6-phosphate isomerase-like protein (cupin superfamily)
MTAEATSAGEITEEAHLEAEKRISKFSYQKPEEFDRVKVSVRLARSDLCRGFVQIVRKDGGETNLHYHSRVDAIWMVLKGRAKFYKPGDEVIGEFGPHEGLLMPRFARYWFECVSDEDLEIMLVQAFDQAGAKNSGRTDSAPRNPRLTDIGEFKHFSAEVE